MGYMNCPDYCSMDTPSTSCRCTCDSKGLHTWEVLNETGILHKVAFFDKSGKSLNYTGTSLFPIPGHTKEESENIYGELYDMLCEIGLMGDMFEASSSNDPVFWVMHSTIDRMWHWKRLHSREKDGSDNSGWDNSYQDCHGHHYQDCQPFKNIWDSENEYYTNMELYTKLDPTRHDATYMYDNFMWTHCAELDMPFGENSHGLEDPDH